MKEKDFKAIITSFDEYSKNKKANDEYITSLIEKLSCNQYLISDYRYSSWALFQVYDEDNIDLFINIKQTQNINEKYIDQYLLNALANRLIESFASDINRTNNTISFVFEKKTTLNILNYTLVENLAKEINEVTNRYSLLLNSFIIIKYLVNQESLKMIDPVILFKLYEVSLINLTENKYYAYLEVLMKALDEVINNKKYTINYFDKTMLLTDLVSEAQLNDYKRLRKAIANAIKVDEEEIKFDSNKEVIIDVNPIETDEIYMWRYLLVGRNIENSGGEYPKTLEYFHTAILKGIFKGLKKITETPSLINKKIVLKCDYQGILSDVMLSNDENKSRMKTIKQLIQSNNLKVTTI